MGKDIWTKDTRNSMTKEVDDQIKAECERQSESCLYTSTSIYIWLRRVRFTRFVFILTPLILSAVAGLGLTKFNFDNYVIVLLVFVASLFPALHAALKIETSIDQIAREASRYKAFQDKFRQISKISISQGTAVALKDFENCMNEFESVRATSITVPERYFKLAQKKITDGDYKFSID